MMIMKKTITTYKKTVNFIIEKRMGRTIYG